MKSWILLFWMVGTCLAQEAPSQLHVVVDPAVDPSPIGVSEPVPLVSPPPTNGNAIALGSLAALPEAQTMMSIGAGGAEINSLFKGLAKRCNLQYFYNHSLDELIVKGRLDVSDARKAIDELAASYGMVAYDNGRTLFVRTAKDMEALPPLVKTYKLHYLRPEKIEELVSPLLTKGNNAGSVKFDAKTNTLILQDNDVALTNILRTLGEVDKRGKVFNVQVRIFRIGDVDNLNAGVDWSQTFGDSGFPISLGTSNSLDMLFNLNGTGETTALFTGPTAAILRPGAINIVVRALKGITTVDEIDSPNLQIEDNEPGKVAFVDRYPIIEFQPATSQATGANFISLSSTVRYKIDSSDPTPTTTEPGRELGVSLYVTPTSLPDGINRLKITPRTASITEFINVPTGTDTPDNQVPRVSESSTTSTVSVPNGMTVLLAGYYTVSKRHIEQKLPVLGDIPGIGFLFKTTNDTNSRTRIIFAITATCYDPALEAEAQKASESIRNAEPNFKELESVRKQKKVGALENAKEARQ